MLLESLGERGQPRIEAIELLALIERETNDLRRVADLRYEAWQWRLKNRGESDPETLRAAVEVCVIEMETIYPHGPNIPDALTTIGKLKALKLRRGETWGRQDEMALVRSLELAAHHYIVLLDDLVTLGTLLDEAIDASTATQGPNHPGTVRLIRLKGLAMLKTGDIERARPLLVEVRERLIERLGKEHLTVLNVEVLLAGAEAQSGRADEALEELGRIEPMLVERVGRDHFRVVSLRLDMARTLRLLGRLDEAHGLIAACHDSLGRMQGPTAYIEKAVAHELALIRVAEGRYAEAEQIMDEYVWLGAPIFKDFEGYKGAAGEWMLDYVDILEKVGKLDKARSGARAAKISLEKGYGRDAPLSRRASETFARLSGF
jgi:tetratricopeptide (TPR) repeat protein